MSEEREGGGGEWREGGREEGVSGEREGVSGEMRRKEKASGKEGTRGMGKGRKEGSYKVTLIYL